MEIALLAQDAELRRAYREWLELPLTKEVLRLASERARPTNIDSPGGASATLSEKALLSYGIQLGYSDLLVFLQTLDIIAMQAVAIEASSRLSSDYAGPQPSVA